MSGDIRSLLFALSYILQLIGFVGICYALGRAYREWQRGNGVPRTESLLLGLLLVMFAAYIAPVIFSVCYFVQGCFQPVYRDFLRLSSGIILFLAGLLAFLLYYTKEEKRG